MKCDAQTVGSERAGVRAEEWERKTPAAPGRQFVSQLHAHSPLHNMKLISWLRPDYNTTAHANYLEYSRHQYSIQTLLPVYLFNLIFHLNDAVQNINRHWRLRHLFTTNITDLSNLTEYAHLISLHQFTRNLSEISVALQYFCKS